jgi:small subunit ribosomal protein S5
MTRTERESGLLEEVIGIYFHTKVTKGGRNLSVAALVAMGDGNGKVGLGYGKAAGVPMAIEKAGKEARARMMKVEMVGDTVAHEAQGRHGAARVLLLPASPGTGVKAGGTVRSIMTVAGIHNVLSKIYGNTNPINVAKATIDALEQMRSLDEVRSLRGVDVQLFHPQARAGEAADGEEAGRREQVAAAPEAAPDAAVEEAKPDAEPVPEAEAAPEAEPAEADAPETTEEATTEDADKAE